MRQRTRVGILAGGPSSEREISLKSGEAVFDALMSAGFDCVILAIKGDEDIEKLLKDNKIGKVFIALHGRFGEDGTIQRILENMNLPYSGSGPEASRLALDKIASHEKFLEFGIPAPPFEILNRNSKLGLTRLEFPVVVKPQFEGSSIGLSVVKDNEEFNIAKSIAFNYGNNIIVEKYIKGRELTVAVYNESALPIVEIRPKTLIYDFKAKYSREDTEYIVPAELNSGELKLAGEYGVSAHNALGCKQFSRVDMILGDDGKFYVLEVNTIPGFTSRSLFPKAAKAAGINFIELCRKIVEEMTSGEKVCLN